MNIGELWKRVLAKIDEFSYNGLIRTETDNIDYRLRFNRIVDEVQKDISKICKISKTKEFSQYPISNQLFNNFDIYQHLNDDIIYETIGSKAYYFEIDGEGIVYIDENINGTWANIKTITIPSTVTEFTTYKGKLTLTSNQNITRIKLSGSYPYQYKNIALYNIDFKNDGLVPAYEPYVKYTMPDNFLKLDKIEFKNYQYDEYNNNFSDYYWENSKTLLINREYKGSFKVNYWSLPNDIPSNDSNPSAYDSTELEVLEIAQIVMINGIAGRLLLNDMNSQGTAISLINFYESEKYNLIGFDKTREKTRIRNIWGYAK